MENRIKNIQKQEEILDEMDAFLDKIEEITEEWKELQPRFRELLDYYQSTQWMEDYEAYDKGELPEMKCGVLSQDAVFNTIQNNRMRAVELMKIALAAIE